MCVSHLDQVRRVLSVEGVLGQLVSVRHPGVSEDLTRRQPPVGVDVQHLRHQILRRSEVTGELGVREQDDGDGVRKRRGSEDEHVDALKEHFTQNSLSPPSTKHFWSFTVLLDNQSSWRLKKETLSSSLESPDYTLGTLSRRGGC